MSKLTVTFPELPDGADSWAMYVARPVSEPVTDNRSWFARSVYTVLMFVHDKAESLWHWCYYKAQRFAPPRPTFKEEHHFIGRFDTEGKVIR